MAGKRYTEKEIAKLVELKDGGKTFDEIAAAIKTEFGVSRNVRSLKVIYDRNKGGSAKEKPAA